MRTNYLYKLELNRVFEPSVEEFAMGLNRREDEWLEHALSCGLAPTHSAREFVSAARATPACAANLRELTPVASALDWLAEALEQSRASMRCRELELELVTLHPDAGVPDPDRRWLEARFLMRSLIELEAETTPAGKEGPLSAVFSAKSLDPLCTEASGTFDDLAGCLLWSHERLAWLPWEFNDGFWERHRESWWAQPDVCGYSLRRDFPEKSDNQPYAMARYRIWLHPGWCERLTSSIVGGAAHWR